MEVEVTELEHKEEKGMKRRRGGEKEEEEERLTGGFDVDLELQTGFTSQVRMWRRCRDTDHRSVTSRQIPAAVVFCV